jgi:hypothetical protein
LAAADLADTVNSDKNASPAIALRQRLVSLNRCGQITARGMRTQLGRHRPSWCLVHAHLTWTFRNGCSNGTVYAMSMINTVFGPYSYRFDVLGDSYPKEPYTRRFRADVTGGVRLVTDSRAGESTAR